MSQVVRKWTHSILSCIASRIGLTMLKAGGVDRGNLNAASADMSYSTKTEIADEFLSLGSLLFLCVIAEMYEVINTYCSL